MAKANRRTMVMSTAEHCFTSLLFLNCRVLEFCNRFYDVPYRRSWSFHTRIPAPAFKYEYHGAGNKVSLYETLCVDIFDRKVYMNTERFIWTFLQGFKEVHDMLSLGWRQRKGKKVKAKIKIRAGTKCSTGNLWSLFFVPAWTSLSSRRSNPGTETQINLLSILGHIK